jgi:hypothetical protein
VTITTSSRANQVGGISTLVTTAKEKFNDRETSDLKARSYLEKFDILDKTKKTFLGSEKIQTKNFNNLGNFSSRKPSHSIFFAKDSPAIDTDPTSPGMADALFDKQDSRASRNFGNQLPTKFYLPKNQ